MSDSEGDDLQGDDKKPSNLATNDTLKALSHPTRREILRVLARKDHARATDIAEELGLQANAVSFHLRTLGKAGLIEEAPELARDGRDRVWKTSNQGVMIRPAEDGSTDPTLIRQIVSSSVAEQQLLLSQFGDWAMKNLESDSPLHGSLMTSYINATEEQMEFLFSEVSRIVDEIRSKVDREDSEVRQWHIGMLIANDQVFADPGSAE